MRSYVKIYGPPLLEAIKALEKISINMPTVCIMDMFLEMGPETGTINDEASYRNYFSPLVPYEIEKERCDKIVSKSGESVGDYDFYFEWFKNPTQNELNSLIEKIDEALTPMGSRYTLTTKKK